MPRQGRALRKAVNYAGLVPFGKNTVFVKFGILLFIIIQESGLVHCISAIQFTLPCHFGGTRIFFGERSHYSMWYVARADLFIVATGAIAGSKRK
ncbi:MAG: hypothetical protein K0R82_1651 [Flavipsychrobacter sp.]|nr:hypothetical protein [Flavipsychrobacter sp.]